MSLSNLTLSTGASVTATGGTTQTFALSGSIVSGGLEVRDVASTDARTAERVSFVIRMPRYDARTGRYSKMKQSVVYTIPTIDAVTGFTDFNLARLEIETVPSLSAANLAMLWNKVSQLAIDADTAVFRQTGGLS